MTMSARSCASAIDGKSSGQTHFDGAGAVSAVQIRNVRPDELEQVWRVHVAASNDLMVRRGRQAARPTDAPVASDARAGLASDPDGYFCAVEEGQIRGMVSA